MPSATADRQSASEELANSVTHGIGAILAVGALAWGLAVAWGSQDPWRIATVSVFGLSLVLLYLASTLYHAARGDTARRRLRIIDHIGVYLLIAGTYTPFTLVTLRDSVGWPLFGAVWGLAVLGMGFEAFWLNRPRWLSVVVYVGLGWMIMFAIRPLAAALPAAGLALLVAGGVSYTFGTLFYIPRRLRYGHAFWHLWVLAGSAFHTAAVILHVMR